MKYQIFYILFFIFNSGIGAKNIYFANLHSHTLLSDGIGTPEQAFSYARDSAQIQILALTEHTHYLNKSSYDYLKQVSKKFTENNRFVALAGQEFGLLYSFGHITVYNAQEIVPISPHNLIGFYNWIKENNYQGQFNHPRDGDFSDFQFNSNGNKVINTIEILNGSGKYHQEYEDFYIRALNRGWQVGPVANQDNHKGKWGDAPTSDGKIFLTGILADSLSLANVIQALSERRVYAFEAKPKTDRIRLKNFSVNETLMGGVVHLTSPNLLIKVEVCAETSFQKIYIYKNGLLYDSCPNSLLSDSVLWVYQDTITDGYYFIKGIQNDGDRFWSAPIWVHYRKPKEALQIHPQPMRRWGVLKILEAVEPDSKIDLSVYNVSGMLVQRLSTLNSRVILEDLAQGVYLVKLKVKGKSGERTLSGRIIFLR